MKAVPEAIIERIKKLLELTTSPNEHEAALAMNQAKRLMLRHSVAYEDLNDEEFKQEIKEEIYYNEIFEKSGVRANLPAMLAIIPPIFGVQCLVRSKRSNNGFSADRINEFALIGFPANIEITKFSLDSLLNQGMIDGKAAYKQFRTITFWPGFWSGFALGLNQKFSPKADEELGITVYDKVKQYVNNIAKSTMTPDLIDGVAKSVGIESGLKAELRSGITQSNTGKLLR